MSSLSSVSPFVLLAKIPGYFTSCVLNKGPTQRKTNVTYLRSLKDGFNIKGLPHLFFWEGWFSPSNFVPSLFLFFFSMKLLTSHVTPSFSPFTIGVFHLSLINSRRSDSVWNRWYVWTSSPPMLLSKVFAKLGPVGFDFEGLYGPSSRPPVSWVRGEQLYCISGQERETRFNLSYLVPYKVRRKVSTSVNRLYIDLFKLTL